MGWQLSLTEGCLLSAHQCSQQTPPLGTSSFTTPPHNPVPLTHRSRFHWPESSWRVPLAWTIEPLPCWQILLNLNHGWCSCGQRNLLIIYHIKLFIETIKTNDMFYIIKNNNNLKTILDDAIWWRLKCIVFSAFYYIFFLKKSFA